MGVVVPLLLKIWGYGFLGGAFFYSFSVSLPQKHSVGW